MGRRRFLLRREAWKRPSRFPSLLFLICGSIAVLAGPVWVNTDTGVYHDVTIRSESTSIAKDAIGKLPYDLRTAVLLYEYEGLSYEGIPAVRVKPIERKLYRARKLLRESLSRSSLR